jgi:sulfur carrier protein ThiS
MKVLVRLYGTLPGYYSGTYPASGLEIEIGEDSSVADLVERIGVPQKRVALVSVNGVLVKGHDLIPNGATVKFFQALSGG